MPDYLTYTVDVVYISCLVKKKIVRFSISFDRNQTVLTVRFQEWSDTSNFGFKK